MDKKIQSGGLLKTIRKKPLGGRLEEGATPNRTDGSMNSFSFLFLVHRKGTMGLFAILVSQVYVYLALLSAKTLRSSADKPLKLQRPAGLAHYSVHISTRFLSSSARYI